jgi:hypothetical protein
LSFDVLSFDVLSFDVLYVHHFQRSKNHSGSDMFGMKTKGQSKGLHDRGCSVSQCTFTSTTIIKLIQYSIGGREGYLSFDQQNSSKNAQKFVRKILDKNIKISLR